MKGVDEERIWAVGVGIIKRDEEGDVGLGWHFVGWPMVFMNKESGGLRWQE